MKKTMVSGVYKFTNLVDGKVYIGSACRSVHKRWTDHVRGLRKNKHNNRFFQEAWNTYGEQNFKFSVVEECAPEHCLDREDFWLACYVSYDRRFGYNIMPTARANRLEAIWSEESRQKASRSSLEVWQRPGMREAYVAASKEYWKDPKAHERHSEMMKAVMNRPEVKTKAKPDCNKSIVRRSRLAYFNDVWNSPEKKAQKIRTMTNVGLQNKRMWVERKEEILKKRKETREKNKQIIRT